jgi:hypothetical protein
MGQLVYWNSGLIFWHKNCSDLETKGKIELSLEQITGSYGSQGQN